MSVGHRSRAKNVQSTFFVLQMFSLCGKIEHGKIEEMVRVLDVKRYIVSIEKEWCYEKGLEFSSLRSVDCVAVFGCGF